VRTDAQENRRRILAAAEEVFGRRGAAGSTEEVARLAGVGIATVFRHFPTKEALIEAALVQHFNRLVEQARAAAKEADAAAALRRLVRTMIETGATKVTLASLVDQETAPEAVLAVSAELRSAVRLVLRRAQRAGAVRTSVTVDEVYLLIRGLAQATATMPTSTRTLGRAVDVVLDGLGLTPPGARLA
jgi:AcrR family transcriptional regulator